MNFIHSVFTIGAIIIPFAAGVLMERGLEWRSIYIFMAVLSGLMALAMGSRFFRSVTQTQTAQNTSQTTWLRLARQPLLILLTLAIFLYVGAELGISAWISEYYVTVFARSAAAGAFMVSIFWGGIFVGRLLASVIYRGEKQALILLVFSCVSVFSLGTALLLKNPVISGLFFFLTGLGYSIIYPVAMVLVGQFFKDVSGMAIGVVSTGGGMGAFVSPLVMSWVASHYSIEHGFGFYFFVSIVMALATGGIFWYTRSLAND